MLPRHRGNWKLPQRGRNLRGDRQRNQAGSAVVAAAGGTNGIPGAELLLPRLGNAKRSRDLRGPLERRHLSHPRHSGLRRALRKLRRQREFAAVSAIRGWRRASHNWR